MAGIVQLRNDTEGRTYHRRKRAEGKTSLEALRCLKRRLSDAVYRQLVADAKHEPQQRNTGPGGHSAATLSSSATDLTPDIGSQGDQTGSQPDFGARWALRGDRDTGASDEKHVGGDE